MALIGYFSFIIGHYCDQYGYKKIFIFGAFAYSIGLALRVIPDSSLVSIVSGLLSGLGASCALCALRVWMFTIATDETRTALVGVKNSTNSLGVALGCALISEEVMWAQRFPQENLGLFFGLNQSAFCLGDFLGGIVNGYFYKSLGMDKCIIIVLIIMLLNFILFLKFFITKKIEIMPC